MKKQAKKLVLAKETVRDLTELKGREAIGAIVGGSDYYQEYELRRDTDKTVCWSVVCTNSGMYTCAC